MHSAPVSVPYAVPCAVPGWWGKIASLGDFASRRLDQPVVRRIDAWLSSGIVASREAQGDQWLANYLAAPPKCFVWAPGVIDSQWWFGFLMPSCDQVGRYYPLLVAQSRPMPPQSAAGFEQLRAWWQHVAAASMQTLQLGATLDAFESALAHPLTTQSWPAPQGDDAWLDSLAAWATHALARQTTAMTLWWPWRGQIAGEGFLQSSGLPDHFMLSTSA